METAKPHEAITGEAADALIGIDNSADTAVEGRGQMRKDISNAMVGLKKQLYGKGPVKAKTFINDNIVFVVLEGGLTRNEETLLAAGEENLVRQYRLRFQEVVKETAHETIERLTGRTVLTYHSQIVFDPDRTFEIFVLDREP
ncbi:MAG: hypothetical protein QOJ57_1293 [Thermoleophilaceae bacterium]|nr:hypothetical protein [Thermoleophilaceae bacterium]